MLRGEVAVITLGERGLSPQLTLLVCTVHADRIEAQGYILHRPLPRKRTLPRLEKRGSLWAVPRGALMAQVPRLMPPLDPADPKGKRRMAGVVSIHGGLVVKLARGGQ